MLITLMLVITPVTAYYPLCKGQVVDDAYILNYATEQRIRESDVYFITTNTIGNVPIDDYIETYAETCNIKGQKIVLISADDKMWGLSGFGEFDDVEHAVELVKASAIFDGYIQNREFNEGSIAFLKAIGYTEPTQYDDSSRSFLGDNQTISIGDIFKGDYPTYIPFITLLVIIPIIINSTFRRVRL